MALFVKSNVSSLNAQIQLCHSGAVRNANNTISLTQTAEDALCEVTLSLQPRPQLTVQSQNGINSCADGAALQKRFQSSIRIPSHIFENITRARLRISNTDFATQTAELTRNQIFPKASLSTLS